MLWYSSWSEMQLCMYYHAKLLRITIIHERSHCCVVCRSRILVFLLSFYCLHTFHIANSFAFKKIAKVFALRTFYFSLCYPVISLSCWELKCNNFQLAFIATYNCRLEECEVWNNAQSLRETLGMISNESEHIAYLTKC